MSQPGGGASEMEESQSFAETRLLLMFFPNTLELYFIYVFLPLKKCSLWDLQDTSLWAEISFYLYLQP